MSYHLTYTVTPHQDGVRREELALNVGACDAVVLISIQNDDRGASSQAVVSLDGRTGKPLPASELWKAWALLAAKLKDNPELPMNKRGLCRNVHELVADAVRTARQEKES